MEQLKKQILKEVPRLDMNSFQWTEFNIRSEKFEEKNGYRVYTEALQSALELADYKGPFLYETMPMGHTWADVRKNHEYLKNL